MVTTIEGTAKVTSVTLKIEGIPEIIIPIVHSDSELLAELNNWVKTLRSEYIKAEKVFKFSTGTLHLTSDKLN